MSGYVCIAFTILLTALGQLLLKWRISTVSSLPSGIFHKFLYLVKLIFIDPFVFMGFFSAFLASLFWLNALNKLDLNIAYPMMSLSFLLVFIFSTIFFHEKVMLMQVVGLLCILAGVCLIGLAGAK